MATQWVTDSFSVGPISAGATLIFAHSIGASRCQIGKTKCVPASGTGTFDMGYYKRATCLIADVVQSWVGVPTAPGLFDPMENSGTGPVERNEGESIPYEDLDAAGNINGKITNHDAGSRSFNVSISYLIGDPSQMLAEAVTFTGTAGSLAIAASAAANIRLYRNGIRQRQGVDYDVAVNKKDLTLIVPAMSDYFEADYS